MVVGHYAVGLAAKKVGGSIPLWILFLAVQLLDLVWAPLVLLGIEKVDIVPGVTASNALDLYYMPFSHSFLAAVLWSMAAFAVYRVAVRDASTRSSLVIAGAVFSHWVLDLIVHRPDLPLFDNGFKVGMGLWNFPGLALGLEIVMLFGGMWLYLKSATARRTPMVVLAIVMLGLHVYLFFGAPMVSGKAAAGMALAAYTGIAVLVWLIERRPLAVTGAV